MCAVIPVFCFAVPSSVLAEDGAPVEEIIITSSRIPIEENRALRSVSVIGSAQLREWPPDSIAQAVHLLPGIDARQRGVFGVQSDISIRGATFEQTAVLIDGVRINDPQTGHHNMDIPFTAADLESIEAVRGGRSSVYGPDAFGGALNVRIKKPEGMGAENIFEMGGNSYLREGVSVTQPAGDLKTRFSYEKRFSSGYRKATDFEIDTYSLYSLLKMGESELAFLGGYSYKDFGASTFYSNLYPNEGEFTDTRFGMVRAELNEEKIRAKPVIYYRRHGDKYILDRDRPSWYRNTHKSYTAGVDMPFVIETERGSIAAGGELSWDKLVSTNMNEHSRNRQAFYGEYSSAAGTGFLFNAGVRADHFSEFGWEASPSVSAGYLFGCGTKLRASFDRSYRIPTFTDLYYTSPSNIGNESLKPESAYSCEAAAEYSDEIVKTQCVYFLRMADNVIDWTRDLSTDPWRAENAGDIITSGIEAESELRISRWIERSFINTVSFHYTFTDSDKRDPGRRFSKYALDYMRYKLGSTVTFALPIIDIKGVLSTSYCERAGKGPYVLMDGRLSREFNLYGFDTECYIEGTNLLNTSYTEITDVIMPGLWIIGGVRIAI